LPFGNDLATFTVLGSLPKSFNQFVMHYNMNGWDKPIMELHAMLVTAEKNISAKPTQVLMVKGGHIKKKNAKAKGKWQGGKGKAKVKGPGPKTTTQPPKKATKNPNCFNCGEPGHWKRDCPKPLTEAKKTSDGGIFVIELYAFSNNSWVFDTGCGTHLCNDLQVLRKARELREGQMVLHVGNGANVTVEAVGEVSLLLPNGLYLHLKHVCYVPSLTRNIISAARLCEQGYVFNFRNGNVVISMNDLIYIEARPHNGIYELDLCSHNDSIYNLNAKRLKLDLNQAYLWHSRLGHINKKRLSKLQTDGILEIKGNESFDICDAGSRG
jgi:hypothetical protein